MIIALQVRMSLVDRRIFRRYYMIVQVLVNNSSVFRDCQVMLRFQSYIFNPCLKCVYIRDRLAMINCIHGNVVNLIREITKYGGFLFFVVAVIPNFTMIAIFA